jgi:hypothetical protein
VSTLLDPSDISTLGTAPPARRAIRSGDNVKFYVLWISDQTDREVDPAKRLAS